MSIRPLRAPNAQCPFAGHDLISAAGRLAQFERRGAIEAYLGYKRSFAAHFDDQRFGEVSGRVLSIAGSTQTGRERGASVLLDRQAEEDTGCITRDISTSVRWSVNSMLLTVAEERRRNRPLDSADGYPLRRARSPLRASARSR